MIPELGWLYMISSLQPCLFHQDFPELAPSPSSSTTHGNQRAPQTTQTTQAKEGGSFPSTFRPAAPQPPPGTSPAAAAGGGAGVYQPGSSSEDEEVVIKSVDEDLEAGGAETVL